MKLQYLAWHAMILLVGPSLRPHFTSVLYLCIAGIQALSCLHSFPLVASAKLPFLTSSLHLPIKGMDLPWFCYVSLTRLSARIFMLRGHSGQKVIFSCNVITNKRPKQVLFMFSICHLCENGDFCVKKCIPLASPCKVGCPGRDGKLSKK